MRRMMTVIVLLAAMVTYGQTFNWVWQNPMPQGNTLTAINVISPTKAIVFGARSVVLRTEDGGVNWAVSYADPAYRNIESSCFLSATTGYVCGDDGLILKTTDGGSTFTVLTSGTTEDLSDIDFIDADSGYAVGSVGTVLKTTNGGLTWNAITTPITVTINTVEVVSADNVYFGAATASAPQLVSRSTDYGVTWTNATPTGATKNITDIFFLDAAHGWCSSQDVGKVFYTTDGGTTWANGVSANLVVPNYVHFIDANTGFVTNNNNGNVYRTADGGATYTGIATGTEPLYCVANSGTSIFAVGRYGSIYKSLDNGLTWNPMFLSVTQKPMRSIKFTSSLVGYSGGGSTSAADSLGFILKTNDGGETWENVGYNFKAQVYSFAIASSNVWYVGNSINQIYKTTDGGATFTLQTHPIVSTTTDFNDMSFVDVNTGYAVSSGGKIIKTTNGGTTWTDANTPFGTSGVWSIYTPNANKVIAVGASAKAYMTTDGGTSWTPMTTGIPGTFFVTRFYNENFGLIGGYSSPNPVLSKTTDGGATWTPVGIPTDQGIGSLWGIGFRDVNTYWVTDVNGVVAYTTDSGTTWSVAKKVAGHTIFSVSVVGDHMWMTGSGGLILKGYSNPNVPVELVSFIATVSGQNIELKWNTATELNNKGFQIEKKIKGSNWTELAFVKGNGTTSIENSYAYTDKNAGSGTISYRLKQIDFDGSYEYSEEVLVEMLTPNTFDLSQNYPNPFNPSTVISYNIPFQTKVELKVYNILGKEVARPVNEIQEAGSYSISFNGDKLSSGVYFYELRAGDYTAKKKMILIK